MKSGSGRYLGNRTSTLARLIIVGLLAIGVGLVPGSARACPFCGATSATLRQEMEASDFVLIAEQVEVVEAPDNTVEGNEYKRLSDKELRKPEFRIVRWLKGKHRFGGGESIRTVYYGQQPAGTKFLIMGADGRLAEMDTAGTDKRLGKIPEEKLQKMKQDILVPSEIVWSVPTELTNDSLAYIEDLIKLEQQQDPVAKLVFFQKYFEHPENMLSTDAYNEFALTDYEIIKQMKPQMERQKYLEWIQDPKVSASHRRQYLTLLGVCGQPEDVPVLEEMILSANTNEQARTALDSLIACYIMLKGPEGLPMIVDRFIKNNDAEYGNTYSAITALRFHGDQADILTDEQITNALRPMLDRPKLADLVIPDLARYEDWSVMDRLVAMFKDAGEEVSWVRVPIINYLRACPLPEAEKHLEELAKLDPETYRKATIFGAFVQRPSSVNSTEAGPPADDDGVNRSPQPGGAAAEPGAAASPAEANKPTTTANEGPTDKTPDAKPAPSEVASAATMKPEEQPANDGELSVDALTKELEAEIAARPAATPPASEEPEDGDSGESTGFWAILGLDDYDLNRNVWQALDWQLAAMVAGVVALAIVRFIWRSAREAQSGN